MVVASAPPRRGATAPRAAVSAQVALAGFTPIPYKVFTIAAGIFRVDFPTFVLASVLSRGARFYLEATLLHFWGDKAREFLEKRFEWITIGGAILLVGGFLAVKYLL